MFNNYNRNSDNAMTLPNNISRICEWPLSGRLCVADAAKILGFGEHDIPILVSEGMLKPLGKPVPNSPKYFAACEIRELAENTEWLNRATQVVYDYWKGKNTRKTASSSKKNTTVAEISCAE